MRSSRRKFIKNLAFGSVALGSYKHTSGHSSLQSPKNSGYEGVYSLTPELETSANKRISEIRKGNFRIRLEDSDGIPYADKAFKFSLTDHAFDWGNSTALQEKDISEAGLEKTRHFKKLFNCTTAKCYWDERWHQPIEHEEGVRVTERFTGEVDWAIHNGLRVKGHPLVWTVRKAIPAWMDKYSYAEQLGKLEAHVRDLIRVGGEDVSRWDLCNEMLWEPSLRNLPDRNWPHIETVEEILSYLEPAFHWAKEENPRAIYSLNDYGIVKSGVPEIITASQQRNRYLELLEEMDKRKCLPDAVGAQCHIGSWYTDKQFLDCMDDLAQSGLPVQVTEFWARAVKGKPDHITGEEAGEALLNNIRMIYTLAFAHPSVSHLSYWGGDFFDDDGKPTTLYHALYDLIKTSWSTELLVRTNLDGECSFNGFYGSYQIKMLPNRGRGIERKCRLLSDNKMIIVII